MTPVLYFVFTVIVEVNSQIFTESVSLRDIGKSTSRAEISSPGLYFKSVKGALYGSAIIAVSFARLVVEEKLIPESNSDLNSEQVTLTQFTVLMLRARSFRSSFFS